MGSSNQWAMGNADGGYAWLENDEGMHAACIERSPHVDGKRLYNTTDEQWQAIIDLTAAAPEMLVTLKNVLDQWNSLRYLDRVTLDGIRGIIAKAEPPRKVKRTVAVTMELEVEVAAAATAEECMALAKQSVGWTQPALSNVRIGKTSVGMVGELYLD